VREVRLIGANREHVGIVSIRDALELAREANLDLVEISPNAEPPVARIMDYGRFIYEQAKKERETRKTQKLVEVKEFRLRPRTNEHDREIKMDQARKWLEDGMKVKVRIRFRGREITYPELAHGQLLEVAQELSEVAVVEQQPDLEGQTMLMILAPKKGAGALVREDGEEEEEESAEDQDT
jgi:translation initiation factor IF-3